MQCGECSKPVRKYGAPIINGHFIDQIIVCTKCEWVGVDTIITDDNVPAQISFIDALGDIKIDESERMI